jgi:outer membrane protein TolC
VINNKIAMTRNITQIITLLFLFLGNITNAQRNLSITDAISIALDNNYDIKIVNANEEVAKLTNHWGTAGRYPSINFNLSSLNKWDNNEQDDFRQSLITGGVGLNWMIFNGFSVNITKSKLNDLEKLSEGRTAVVVEGTIQAITLAYYKVMLDKESLGVLDALMKLSKDRYDYEKMRQDIGSSVTFQVLQAQNSYLVDKANYISQEVYLKKSIRDLNFLMGEKEGVEWGFPDTFKPEIEEYALSELLDKMLSNNNTLKNQFINQSILEREIALSKSKYYPSLSLSTGVEGNKLNKNYDVSNDLNSNSWNYFGNLSLNYNLYSGGVRSRAVKIAKINEDIGSIDIESLKHSLSNDLLNLYEFYKVRQELLDVATEAVEAAELNMQIAEEKFRNGSINSFNYRDVQLIYLNAALGRLQAIYSLIESKISLMRITGGIITELE